MADSLHLLFNPGGNLTAFFFFALLPPLMLAAAWAKRRNVAAAPLSLRGRGGVIAVVLLTVYYGFLLNWLIIGQFQSLTLERGELVLRYPLLGLTERLPVTTVQAIEIIKDDPRTYRMQRLVIVTQDGQRYTSTQVRAATAAQLAGLLRQALSR